MKLTPQYIMEQYRRSGKRHLFITGYRQVGKTTLFNKILPIIEEKGKPLHGLTSYMVPKTAVMLRDNITGAEGAVGIYCPEKATVGKNMIPHSDGFFAVGIPAMEKALISESRWVTIDELGFLESGETGFQQAVKDVLDKKQVLAVIRKLEKGKVLFIDELIERDDVFILDLDNYDKEQYFD